MSFLIKQNWKRLNSDLWKSVEKSISAPADMYIELLRFRLLEIGKEELIKPKNVEALNSGEIATQRFKGLQTPASEGSCVSLLIGYYEVLKKFETKIAERYRKKTV